MVEFTLCANGAQVSERDVFGDGKSQAGAAGLTGSGLIDSVEALEKAWKVFRGDARAEVSNVKFNAALAGARP